MPYKRANVLSLHLGRHARKIFPRTGVLLFSLSRSVSRSLALCLGTIRILVGRFTRDIFYLLNTRARITPRRSVHSLPVRAPTLVAAACVSTHVWAPANSGQNARPCTVYGRESPRSPRRLAIYRSLGRWRTFIYLLFSWDFVVSAILLGHIERNDRLCRLVIDRRQFV